jgi:hypothetical protein
LSGETQEKSPVTRAKFDHGTRRHRANLPQRASENAHMSHPPIHATQVTTGLDGRWRLGGQFIKPLGFNATEHQRFTPRGGGRHGN